MSPSSTIECHITANELPHGLPCPLEIVRYCQNTVCRPYPRYGTAWPGPSSSSTTAPTVWIKWGVAIRMSEARTQDYLAGVVNAAPDSAVRVPRIHLAFMYEGDGYIVMEYVAGVTVQQLLQKPNATRAERNRIYKAVAAAVKQLIEIRVSADTPPGPVGGGIIGHPCFDEDESDVKYDTVGALETHFNNALALQKRPNRVSFAEEVAPGLSLCYGHIHEAHFIMGAAGRVYVTDFEHVSFLPPSFVALALAHYHVFTTKIAAHIEYPISRYSPNCIAIRIVAGLFVISSNHNSYGLPKLK